MSASGILWTASPVKHYGYGAGRAHPSVEHVACPVCKAPKGSLCVGADGTPHLDRHYKRCDAYRDLKRKLARTGKTIVSRWGPKPERRLRTRWLGSRFAVCGFRGCRARATSALITGVGENRVRHLLCCHSCAAPFVKKYR